jgi:hypothetical protein
MSLTFCAPLLLDGLLNRRSVFRTAPQHYRSTGHRRQANLAWEPRKGK